MAAKLVEGQEYGLSSIVTDGRKTLIHFKLTDSALRALEEYSKIKGACHQKPTIQFNNSSGVMCIPSKTSSSADDGKGSFKLTLANIHGDANGSFDCIQQLTASHASGLHCLGSMQYKVTTHANNDVYTDTRKKFAIADTESKKICAKEIKMSSRFRGKMVKKVIPSSQYKGLQASKLSPLATAGSRITPPPSRALSPHQPVGLGKSVVSSNGVMKLEGQAKSKATSGVINMPYRDRVIQLLALRSYKKPELLARLMKDGIREKDRNSLGALLKQISVTNKDNSFSLAKHAWQYVRSDWPYYSESDRELLKKNRQLQDPRASVTPSPAVHPADRQSPLKRKGGEDYTEFPVRKQRLSHLSRQQQQPLSAAPPLPVSQHHHVSQSQAARAAEEAMQSSTSSAENRNRGGNADATPPEYLMQYMEIRNCTQRQHYKDDFNKLYGEYNSLLERMQSVTQKFVNLKERVLNSTEGTPEFEELCATVMEEYERHKDDTQFWQDKRQLDFLHGKLAHIKKLIKEFDSHRHERECSL